MLLRQNEDNGERKPEMEHVGGESQNLSCCCSLRFSAPTLRVWMCVCVCICVRLCQAGRSSRKRPGFQNGVWCVCDCLREILGHFQFRMVVRSATLICLRESSGRIVHT